MIRFLCIFALLFSLNTCFASPFGYFFQPSEPPSDVLFAFQPNRNAHIYPDLSKYSGLEKAVKRFELEMALQKYMYSLDKVLVDVETREFHSFNCKYAHNCRIAPQGKVEKFGFKPCPHCSMSINDKLEQLHFKHLKKNWIVRCEQLVNGKPNGKIYSIFSDDLKELESKGLCQYVEDDLYSKAIVSQDNITKHWTEMTINEFYQTVGEKVCIFILVVLFCVVTYLFWYILAKLFAFITSFLE